MLRGGTIAMLSGEVSVVQETPRSHRGRSGWCQRNAVPKPGGSCFAKTMRELRDAAIPGQGYVA